ncbi:MAG TPA: alpha-glucan family phosphorylase [Candidatus Acidoferrales bacterium]|nr:alpha-glucan family phosphorylase [Candidatus Acidoferrales bacterium]
MLTPEADDLRELALDVRWSCDRGSEQLWRTINAAVWEETRNAWHVLRKSGDRLRELATDQAFLRLVRQQARARQAYLDAPTWFSGNAAAQDVGLIAYFSMEFGLSEALPIYAGGLGILAGDYLKTASDLGVPAVGIGLLYRQGYFQQRFDAQAGQQELYPVHDPNELPITGLRNTDGTLRSVSLALPGRTLHLALWEVQVGRVRLYLLDSAHPDNDAADQALTARLYIDEPRLRLEQEMALGIGGIRALEALGLEPQIVHLNEGHSAFAIVERARLFMERHHLSFQSALRCTRAGNVFTTHTAVAAAFDQFPAGLIDDYLGTYAVELGLSSDEFLKMGTETATGSDAFAMPRLALRGCGGVNAVSRLHEAVSRRLFASLYPRWPLAEIPVMHVTNGVHVPSWESDASNACWTAACGAERGFTSFDTVQTCITTASDETLWNLRREQRLALTQSLKRFDPNILTLGFARRFTGYKRADLLLSDPERLARLLTNAERPVQLVIAGKAHPSDTDGKHAIHRWLAFVARPDLRERAMFVPDYDLGTAQTLIEGVDVWLNMPRRTWEASGTSGMKVLVNGGLTCSTLDGWWDEAYEPELGWAIGSRTETTSDEQDAQELYRLLETEITPEFYARDGQIPRRWLARIRASMAQLTPRFSTGRMMHEYLERLYRPAATQYQRRVRDDGAAGARLEAQLADLANRWPTLAFHATELVPAENGLTVRTEIELGAVHPDEIAVELYADALDDQASPERHRLEPGPVSPGTPPLREYRGLIATQRPPQAYTARVVPTVPDARIPMEFAPILWQR